METVHSSKFVETVIEMGKDFDADWIKEMIVSRVLISNFPSVIAELESEVSSNEMNGARYAIKLMEELA